MSSHMAELDPRITKRVIIDICRSTKLATKENYASVLKDWWGFTLERGLNPFKQSIDPLAAIYWQYCNSRKVWSAALA